MPEIHAWTFNEHTLVENAQEAKRLADWIHAWAIEQAPYKLDLGLNASALSITLRQLVAALAAPAAPLSEVSKVELETDPVIRAADKGREIVNEEQVSSDSIEAIRQVALRMSETSIGRLIILSRLEDLNALRSGGREAERTDYNEPLELAKQRVEIVERVMKLPYIKATRDTERGEERFVARDDLVKAVHDYASVKRATPGAGTPAAKEDKCDES